MAHTSTWHDGPVMHSSHFGLKKTMDRLVAPEQENGMAIPASVDHGTAPEAERPIDFVPNHVSQNIDGIVAFYRREEKKISESQRLLEVVGGFMGQPRYLAIVFSIVALWIVANVLVEWLGFRPIDPPPFYWLQGGVSLGAMLTATVVLITQNREAKLEEQRSELELQVNLLTEQKTTTLIRLIEELRRDLPMVRDRHDPVAAAMQEPTDPRDVLAALEERRGKA